MITGFFKNINYARFFYSEIARKDLTTDATEEK